MTKKKKGIIDKVVMGAIIGTAVGSVIGLTVAPKKGKETRKDVKKFGKLAKETTLGFITLFKKVLSKKEEATTPEPPERRNHQGFKKIPTETTEETQEKPINKII
tara:strand:- start:298 stop:612 length:315 start_codon:yes stop_codon:yes gene_type:complete